MVSSAMASLDSARFGSAWRDMVWIMRSGEASYVMAWHGRVRIIRYGSAG